MGSEVRVLREKRRCVGVLSIPSDSVFRKSSRDKCGSWLASIAFFQNILCYFNTVLSLPVGSRIPRRLCNVFKLVLGSKLLKLHRVELWAVVSGESVSKTMSCQMRFQFDVKYI